MKHDVLVKTSSLALKTLIFPRLLLLTKKLGTYVWWPPTWGDPGEGGAKTLGADDAGAWCGAEGSGCVERRNP